MRCGGFSMIGTNGKEAGVYPLRCKRWGCRTCGPRKARATMKRVRAGMALGAVRFFTLTSPGSIFARADVLGFQRLEYDLTPDANRARTRRGITACVRAQKPDR